MRWSFVIMLAGCQGGVFGGVAVGNPTMNGSLARTEGVALELAKTHAVGSFVPCRGGSTTEVDLGEINLVQGFRFSGPAELTCELHVSFLSALQVSGSGAGGSLEATLTPVGVAFVLEPVDAVGRASMYDLELGATDWLGPLADDLAVGDVRLNPSSPEYDALVNSLVTGSGLYVDDGDGVLSDAQRAAGPIVSGAPSTLVVGTDDTGP